MPTCVFSLKDLNSLVKKTIKQSELKDLLEYAKAELEGVSGDEITVQFNDTNMPYLWSVEGLAIFLRGVLGKEKGIPNIKINKGAYKINVDSSLKSIRPHIAAFVAKGKKVNDHFLKQLIQMQEKFCEAYGRRREKIAMGVYPAKKITFPVSYKAVPPRSVKFVPLEFMKEMDLLQILDQHPTGKEYAWILKGLKKYPLLIDYNKEVLSFPPIINSENTGRLSIEDDEIFFEATGTDLDSVNLAANIFAQIFYERGFDIFSVNIGYSRKPMTTPEFKTSTLKFKKEDVRLQCERELKGKLLSLRQGYILTGGKKNKMSQLIDESMVTFTSLFKALLFLKDSDVPVKKSDVILLMCREFDLDESVFSVLLAHRSNSVKVDKNRLKDVLKKYIAEIGKLSEVVDSL